MKRGQVVLVSLALGLAALVGMFAVIRTAAVGRSTQKSILTPAQIAARNRVLDRTEAKLHRILNGKSTSAPGAAQAQRVIYVRPAPHIVTIHRHAGEEA